MHFFRAMRKYWKTIVAFKFTLQCTVWKNKKFTFINFLREINYLVTFAFTRFLCANVWKILWFSLFHIFLTKISWKQRFTKEVTKQLISRKLFRAFYSTFPHCVYWKLISRNLCLMFHYWWSNHFDEKIRQIDQIKPYEVANYYSHSS